jgi:C4-dicarboxylate-specific signal transduction histidine kinase
VSLVAIAATTLLCVRDQTSRIRLEQASAQLVHAARISTLGQLTASIAHEVNQPLAAIINYAKSGKRWLSRDVPDVAEVANCLDHIVTSGSRAADVISRVRALARRGEQQVQALDLAKLAEESMALVYAEARAARVTMLFSRGDSVPPVRGDRVQIQQVIVNLLMNALQAMRDGESGFRELRIRVESGVPGTVRLAVGDTGPGIDGEIARIFEPFYTTRADGMGMGLSICRSIIEAQGGHIEAANNPDIGATVAFTLPAHTSV